VTALDPVRTYRITAEYEPVAAPEEPEEPATVAAIEEPEPTETVTTEGSIVIETPTVVEDIPNDETPTTEGAVIDDTVTPLTNFFPKAGEMFADTTWSLASAILSGIGIILAIVLLVSLVAARREDVESRDMYYDNPREQRAEAARRQRMKTCRIVSIIFCILTPVVWFILDRLTAEMVWINGWTLLVGAVFVVGLVFFLVHRSARKLPDDYADFNPTEELYGK
jgi:NADH:ubiquinone oxidoreductase subunit 3 (subunit A)